MRHIKFKYICNPEVRLNIGTRIVILRNMFNNHLVTTLDSISPPHRVVEYGFRVKSLK